MTTDSPALWYLAVGLLLALASCGGSALTSTLATVTVAGEAWLDRVEAQYEAEQRAVLDSDAPAADMQAALDATSKRYKPAFSVWEAFVAAWDAAAACGDVTPIEASCDRALGNVVAALATLAEACRELGVEAP